MKIVALAGGVGGAKLAQGLAQILPPEKLTVIANTGDDFTYLGLSISPDVDTLCYTLAGFANPQTGWGRAEETWHAQESLEQLGGQTWFQLGDRDLATHLLRSHRLQNGDSLSSITRDFCRAWGVRHTVLPMSDDPVRTIVRTAEEGELPFQDYFVRRGCAPRVLGFRFDGAESARPAPGVLEAIAQADAVVICPSNPWVSIAPILAVAGVKSACAAKPLVAVSPIIGGKAVKGPAAKMYTELGIQPSALAVAKDYGSLLDGFLFDSIDAAQEKAIQDLGIRTKTTDSLMKDEKGRRRLAKDVIDFTHTLI